MKMPDDTPLDSAFTFGTKAETLHHLAGRVRSGLIGKSVHFSCDQWLSGSERVLATIQRRNSAACLSLCDPAPCRRTQRHPPWPVRSSASWTWPPGPKRPGSGHPASRAIHDGQPQGPSPSPGHGLRHRGQRRGHDL